MFKKYQSLGREFGKEERESRSLDSYTKKNRGANRVNYSRERIAVGCNRIDPMILTVIYKYRFPRRGRTSPALFLAIRAAGIYPGTWNGRTRVRIPLSFRQDTSAHFRSQRSPLSHVLLAGGGVGNWRAADVIRLERRMDLSRLRLARR